MKFMKRKGIYQASNVTFNPKTLEAYSYRHWCFLKVINGLLVFNAYRYSVSTSRHQRKVEQLLFDLNIKIDLEVQIEDSLNNQTIKELIKTTEEKLCDDFLIKKLRSGIAYDKRKEKMPSLVERTLNSLYSKI